MKVYVVIGLEDYKGHYDSDISSIQIFQFKELAEEYKKKLIDVYYYVDADIFEKDVIE